MAARVKIGDVLEIPLNDAFAYAQVTHHIEPYGWVVHVFDALHKRRPTDMNQIVQGPVRFYIFFPVAASLKLRLVERVTNLPVDSKYQGRPRFLAGNPNPRTNKIEKWMFWLGDDKYEPIEYFTDEHRKLPIAGIWNIAFLRSRIEEGWTPEMDPRK